MARGESQAKVLFERAWGTSLVVQWMELCLPTQRVWIRSLVQEDSACRAPKSPVSQLLSLCATTNEAHLPWSPAAEGKAGLKLPTGAATQRDMGTQWELCGARGQTQP